MGANPIVQKWWDYMADIMEVNPDNSPVTIPLPEVFHMDSKSKKSVSIHSDTLIFLYLCKTKNTVINDMEKTHLCSMGILYSFQSEYCRISRGAFYSYDYGRWGRQ